MAEKTIDSRSKEADDRTSKAYEEMIKSGIPVTFSSLAKQAGVSRPYLYKSEKWSGLIKEIRDGTVPAGVEQKEEESEIARMKIEILGLKRENARLKDQIDQPHLYIGKANRLEKENAELKTANKELREKIAELNKQLQAAYKLQF